MLEWDVFSRCCLDCATARKRGITVEALREARELLLREWLEDAFQYYATTTEWPPPQRNALGHYEVPNDRFSRVVLTVGQVLSAVACALTVVGTVWSLAVLGYYRKAFPEVNPGVLAVELLLAGLISFAFWLAVFFAFGRAKWVARLVECQQAVLARVLGRITGEVRPTQRPPVFALPVVEVRTTLGGGVVLECDATGHRVPRFRGGEVAEIVRADGTTFTAIVDGEEIHVRTVRRNRVAVTLRNPSLTLAVSPADVEGAAEVRIDFRGPT